MKSIVKIYGERNTNTNYLSKLIDLNLNAQQLRGIIPRYVLLLQKMLPGDEAIRDIYFSLTYPSNLGWKHTSVLPQDELKRLSLVDEKLLFITISKNPYSWLLSLHRRPYHQYSKHSMSFDEFLSAGWRTVGRDGMGKACVTPIELWNIKNRSYLNMDPAITLHVKSEEISINPKGVIDRMSDDFGFQRKSSNFIDYSKSTKDSGKDSSYYRDYYQFEKWREKLSPEAIRIINQSVDVDLMSALGYEMIG
ncbi:MAG: hypothetical protein AAF065_01385 [Verrucomicrobiota bacterium]